MKTQNRLQFPAILLAVFLVLIVTSCEVDKEENKPVVVTVDVTEIKSKEALCSGLIISDGGYAITACGVCWSTEQNPTIDDNKTTDSIGAGSFSSQITGLQPKENYYVRAYATNSEGTGYGMAMAFETIDTASLSTTEPTEISYRTAVCGGTITSDGGQTITARGVCWSTSADSVELENALGFTVDGSGIGGFESVISELSIGATYYVRAYATHSRETNYGNTISFTTREYGKMTDINGYIYNTVTIGTQTWMAENLKVTKYNDGTNIPNVTDGDEWSNLATGAYCNYDNDQSNVATYGRLYNWYAVNTGKLCPTGWHVPSHSEWTILEDYLIANGYNFDGTTTEDKIAKSLASKTGWELYDEAGTIGAYPESNNSTGFTALPGGRRYSNGSFRSIGNYGGWWSSEYHTDYADYLSLNYSNYYLKYSSTSKENGFSVRCVRD